MNVSIWTNSYWSFISHSLVHSARKHQASALNSAETYVVQLGAKIVPAMIMVDQNGPSVSAPILLWGLLNTTAVLVFQVTWDCFTALIASLTCRHTFYMDGILSGYKNHTLIWPLCSPVSSRRYFTNISIGGRDYSFNNDGYLSKPLLDVISYANGRGWEEVSTQLCKLALIIIAQWPNWLTVISQSIKHANSWLLSFTFLPSHCLGLSHTLSVPDLIRSPRSPLLFPLCPLLFRMFFFPALLGSANSRSNILAVRGHV